MNFARNIAKRMKTVEKKRKKFNKKELKELIFNKKSSEDIKSEESNNVENS